ncbi:MAG: hypothetical protein JSV05_09545 [Candidatus Bathyarchaeota archaeon]|nr:MAG: hypothetical protein JSV05_09545 [Candidatus Bathyarchaeota archaeon]
MHSLKCGEGDYIKDNNKIIFDVKGFIHPPNRIVAFPRFIPDSHGDRELDGTSYKKIYPLLERYKFLEERLPRYLIFDPVFGMNLCEVPKKDIQAIYRPSNRLRELRTSSQLDEMEKKALSLIEYIQNISNIPWDKLGISGSLLVRLHTPKSDIDPVVYGEKNCFKLHATLRSAMNNEKSEVKRHTEEELRALCYYRSQDTTMPSDLFIKTESRKVLQGRFGQREFYIRCIKSLNETVQEYGDYNYQRVGYAKISATVLDDSEAIFTPCRYPIDNVKLLEGAHGTAVKEIVSFRGRFCEQAREGESVIAQGKVEKVQGKIKTPIFRLILGGQASDFMVLER